MSGALPVSKNRKHNTWEKISVHTAKCDKCHEHNTNVVQRCKLCNQQFCKNCMPGCFEDGRHEADIEKLDWTPSLVISAPNVRQGPPNNPKEPKTDTTPNKGTMKKFGPIDEHGNPSKVSKPIPTSTPRYKVERRSTMNAPVNVQKGSDNGGEKDKTQTMSYFSQRPPRFDPTIYTSKNVDTRHQPNSRAGYSFLPPRSAAGEMSGRQIPSSHDFNRQARKDALRKDFPDVPEFLELLDKDKFEEAEQLAKEADELYNKSRR